MALGVAGLQPLIDYRGSADTFGRPLTSTVIALADELASAAEIVTARARERRSRWLAVPRSGRARAAAARSCGRPAAICFGERR